LTGSVIPVLWPTQIDSTSANLCDELNEAISDKILGIVQLSYKIATIGQKLLILSTLFGDPTWVHCRRSATSWSVISQCDGDCATRSLIDTSFCTKAAHFRDWQGSCNCLSPWRVTSLRKVLYG
jgi:hypothetical protein